MLGLLRRTALALPLAALAAVDGCWPPPEGNDLFRVAVSGSPGSLLSVWGDPSASRHAFLAGGFVGVDPSLITDGAVGRLVEYTPGAFHTVCSTDQVLWWVTGARDGSGTVFAVGEGGRVIRYQNGHCDTLTLNVTYPAGVPTFFGAVAFSASDVWLVGGSALPTGPRGVLVHYDGTTFTQEATLPMEATPENIFKIDAMSDRTLVVAGTHHLVMQRDPSTLVWTSIVPTGVRSEDSTLFTVSCDGTACYAVGGIGAGLVVRGYRSGDGTSPWETVGSIGPVDFTSLSGLNGVWIQNAQNVFMVGNAGVTAHTNGFVAYTPPMPPTGATLHGVGGSGAVVLAVGGELGVTDASQRGVILIRGDASEQFTFDGRTFMATGALRTSLGGAGQGGR